MFKNLSEKMMGLQFSKVENAVWDLSSGKLGIKTADGIATLNGIGDEAEVEINMMEDFGMAIPAFAQAIPIDQVKVGDIIYSGNKLRGWVVSINSRPATPRVENPDGTVKSEAKSASIRLRMMSPQGHINNWNPPKINLMGMGAGGVKVLRSLITMLPTGEAGLGNMQSMLPMLAMAGGDLEEMMPMLLMSQMNGSSGDSNSMLNTMLMMKLMGKSSKGSNGSNFFDNLGG